MRCLALTAVLLAACGSTSEPGGDDEPVPPACEPADDAVALDAGSTWTVRAIAIDGGEPWAVLERRTAELSDLVIVDRAGLGATLITGIAQTSGLEVAPVVFEGRRCIGMHVFDEVFRFACEDGTVEEPGLDLGGRIVGVADGGLVHMFGDDFAAYHELRRTGGTWREIEKFESSISSAEDAVLHQGTVTSCFLATSDVAAIDVGASDSTYGTEPAQWCRLIAGGELGILTDRGLAALAGDAIGIAQPTVLTERPLAAGRVAGAPAAIVRTEQGIAVQPLPDGAPTELVADAGSGARATFAGDRAFVVAIDAGEVVTSTRCLE